MNLLLIAGSIFALSGVLDCVAYAVLSNSNVRSTRDLVTAADWILFVGAAAGLAALSAVLWRLIMAGRWSAVAELSGACAASLLIVIGLLVIAANSPDGAEGGDVVSAVGIGGWAVIALVIAARRALREQAAPLIRQSDLWLVAAGAVTLLAIGTGLPVGGTYGRGTAIASSILKMMGVGVLTGCLVVAARRRFIAGRGLSTLLAGLVILAVGYLVAAVAYGFVFSPSATLTTVRIGVSLPAFVGTVGYGVLTVAAFQRLAELEALATRAPSPQQPWGAPPPGPFTGPPPPWAYTPHRPPGWGPQPPPGAGAPPGSGAAPGAGGPFVGAPPGAGGPRSPWPTQPAPLTQPLPPTQPAPPTQPLPPTQPQSGSAPSSSNPVQPGAAAPPPPSGPEAEPTEFLESATGEPTQEQ